jgi:hypothetical protein
MDTSIPTSDLYFSSSSPNMTSKHLAATRLAKANNLHKSLANRKDQLPQPPPSEEQEQEQEIPLGARKTRKPSRLPKPKLTAKEKTQTREERAALKKQCTAERRAQKGDRVQPYL